MTWTTEQTDLIGASHELEIQTRRAGGSYRGWTPIWVVVVGAEVFVRSWFRRDTGWFGQVLRDPRARVRVPGLDPVEVDVQDLRDDRRDEVDDAYRGKYGAGAGSMVTDDASLTTLRLTPASA